MLSVFKPFDAYTLRARVFPALIAGLPTLVLLFMLVPWNRLELSQLIASTMAVVLLFAFADVARRAGRRIEAKLGTRSTLELWHSDNSVIDRISKDRYKAFIAEQLKVKAPTAQDEASDLASANEFYQSAGNWLRDKTRDTKKFKLLFEELLTYGFRRNLLGLKPIALVMNLLVLIACGLALFFRWRYEAISYLDEKLLLTVAAAVMHSAFMILAVSKASVKEASNVYGRQLILSCEALSSAPKAAPRVRKAKGPSQ